MKTFKEIQEVYKPGTGRLSDGEELRKIKALAAKNKELKDCIQEMREIAHTAVYKNSKEASSLIRSMKSILARAEKAPL